MSCTRHYDTVAFDARDDATMLFFARTTTAGEIEDYLLLLCAEREGFDRAIYLEVNENQLGGHDLIAEARMSGNVLTLGFSEPVRELDGASEMIVSFDDSPENRASIEIGAFRVLGSILAGGNA